MRQVVTAALAAAFSMAAAGCDESISSLAGPTPNLRPTFSSIRTEIFQNGDSSGRVACIQCHNPGGRLFTGGLDLATDPYTSLVGVASRDNPGAVRVVPGDAENSYLLHKIEGRQGIVGLQMPRLGPPLTSGQIEIIRRWIAEGARND